MVRPPDTRRRRSSVSDSHAPLRSLGLLATGCAADGGTPPSCGVVEGREGRSLAADRALRRGRGRRTPFDGEERGVLLRAGRARRMILETYAADSTGGASRSDIAP